MAGLSPEQLKEMVRMRRRGLSASAIARHFDVTPQAIDYRLRTSRARILDENGKLHPLTGRLPDRIRAVVWLHPQQQTPPPDTSTADRSSGCDGQAQQRSNAALLENGQGPKGPVADSLHRPECLPIERLPVRPTAALREARLPSPPAPRPARPLTGKIKLTGLPSSMEQLAESWKGKT